MMAARVVPSLMIQAWPEPGMRNGPTRRGTSASIAQVGVSGSKLSPAMVVPSAVVMVPEGVTVGVSSASSPLVSPSSTELELPVEAAAPVEVPPDGAGLGAPVASCEAATTRAVGSV